MENYPLENPLSPIRKSPSESPEEKTASKKRSGEALISGEKINLLKRKIDNIVAEIEKLNPEKISPEWIFKNCSSEHNIIRKKFRTIEGKINWQLFVDLLPSDMKDKWSYEEHRDWSGNKAKAATTRLLEKKNPKTFNAQWLRENDYGLYRHLRRKLKNKEGGKIEWENFISGLPEEWQERWIRGTSQEKKEEGAKKRTKLDFGSAITKLNELLEQHNPDRFSSSDIGKLDPQLYSYFKRYAQREKGGIDWKRIMKEVDEKFQKSFLPPKRFEDEYPENRYENESEVEELINSKRDALLTFLVAKDSNDFRKRNELCLELIRLAKKGNIVAEEKLIENIEMLAMEWIDKEEIFKVYEMDTEGLRERIRRCIYLYREDSRPIYFVSYLYKNLQEEAKGKKYRKIELDKLSRNSDGRERSRHDVFDLESYFN